MFKGLLKILLGVLLVTSVAHARVRSGGGSDGGGNSYKGKPLESYARNPEELLGFQEVVEPILADLQKKASYSNQLGILKNLMSSIFTQKIWYFVPGPIEQVSNDLLKSAVRTDQAALQNFDRVWIDENIWNSMSSTDQGQLLLHEAFMGLKILRFANFSRLCRAAYPDDQDCYDGGNALMDERIVLTSQDYVDVQRMTIQARNQFLLMNAPEWMKMIHANGLWFGYDWFNESEFLTPSEFGNLLKQSTMTGYLPTYGYNLKKLSSEHFLSPQDRYVKIKKVKETCAVFAEVKGSDLSFKVSSKSENFSIVIPLKEKIESTFGRDAFENRAVKSVGMFYPTRQSRSSGGYTSYMISFNFDDYELASVSVQEMVCEDIDCEKGGAYDVRGGLNYLCSDSNTLFKP